MINTTDLELEWLTKDAILKPVDYSEWTSPVVIVQKPNVTFRICDDYRWTVNANTENDNYPLPRMEKWFSKLTGAKFFTAFDLRAVIFVRTCR